MKANSTKELTTDVSIDSQILGEAIRAVEQPCVDLARVRIRDNHLEFTCMDDAHVVLSVSRISLDESVEDSEEFSVDRRSVEHLAARTDGSVQIRADNEIIAFRSGDHIYSSISQPESEGLSMSSRKNPVRMEVTAERLRRLEDQLDAPRIEFAAEDEDLWLTGNSTLGSQVGGSVRVPSDNVTVPTDCQTIVNSRYVTRIMPKLPLDAECTVLLGNEVPLWIVTETDSVESRHVIAPRVSGEKAIEKEGGKVIEMEVTA